MKSVTELHFPDTLSYSPDHFWVLVIQDKIRIGITDYAQDQLGDIVYVDLPEPGEHFEAGREFGSIESVKTVSQLHLPMAGTVASINSLLEDEPATISAAPYEEGWLVEIAPDGGPEVIPALISRASYLEMLSD